MKYKNIPIDAAKKLAKEYEKDVVVIIAFDRKYNQQCVATYGKTLQDCIEAAAFGNGLKRNILKWPEEHCNAKPARQKKMEQKNENDKITNLLKDRPFNIKTF